MSAHAGDLKGARYKGVEEKHRKKKEQAQTTKENADLQEAIAAYKAIIA